MCSFKLQEHILLPCITEFTINTITSLQESQIRSLYSTKHIENFIIVVVDRSLPASVIQLNYRVKSAR